MTPASPICRPGTKSSARVMAATMMMAISTPMISQIMRRRWLVGAVGFIPFCAKFSGRGASSSFAVTVGIGVGDEPGMGGATLCGGMAALILPKPGLLLLMDAPFHGDEGGTDMKGLPMSGLEGGLAAAVFQFGVMGTGGAAGLPASSSM